MEKVQEYIPWLPLYKSCSLCRGGIRVNDGIAKKCSCREDYENEILFVKNLIDTGLLAEYSSKETYDFLNTYSLDSYKGPDVIGNKVKIEKYLNNFESRFCSTNLFFTGMPGSQKTSLAKYMICHLVKSHHSCYYILANTLIQMIIDSSRIEEAKQLLQKIQVVDFLVIDEIDQEKIVTYESGWQKKHLLPWLKPITNIGVYFEGAIQDLIEREVPDHTMVFSDKYVYYREEINLEEMWRD
jgi:hypothetical protein